MRFTGLFTFLSLVVSVLAGRYIVILRPRVDLDRFLAKLARGGDIWVVRKYEGPSFFNGAVITTNDYDEVSLRKFPEVLIAELDRIITLDPQPVPLPSPIDVTPVPLPSPIYVPDVPPVPLPSPIDVPDVPPVSLPSPIDPPPVPLPSPISENLPGEPKIPRIRGRSY